MAAPAMVLPLLRTEMSSRPMLCAIVVVSGLPCVVNSAADAADNAAEIAARRSTALRR